MACAVPLSSVYVETVSDTSSIAKVISRKVEYQQREGIDDPFYVVDVNEIVNKHEQWQRLMPRVTPYYAISCLSEPGIIELLARVGLSFDCSSKNEIQMAMEAGVEADRIIYASPCKQPDMLRFAALKGVDLMTFDNEEELHKIKRLYPTARLVMRLLPPRTKRTHTDLGHKYGCPLEEVRDIMGIAKSLNLNVMGISFHVGSNCTDASSFAEAVEAAAVAFDIGKSEGLKLELLDIGGGFPGQPDLGVTMDQILKELMPALDVNFPEESGVRIIAEPGSFFVGTALHLVVQVIGRRVTTLAVTPEGFASPKAFEYYLNDGAYGSLCPGAGIHRPLTPASVADVGDKEEDGDALGSASVARSSDGGRNGSERELFFSTLYGPTCDGTDVIASGVAMPQRNIGDWLIYWNMGHYSISRACAFNGMPRPRMYYVQLSMHSSKTGAKE